ncbi:MAG: TIGR04086 family membrane protein [Acutalibacteraceae bacterium]|nr:TIGR04086 family membrane protein [Acutalibacteraceae bacterium]
MYKDNSKLIILRSVLIGVLVGIAVCSVLIVLLSFLLVKMGQLPTNTVYILLQIIGALSAFLGGYTAVRIYKSMGLLLGVSTAFIMFLIVFLIGISTSVESVSMLSLTKLVAMLCAGAVGGILSVNKRKKVGKYK